MFPSDEVDSLAFGVRKTTTRLPVNTEKNPVSGEPEPVTDDGDDGEEEETTVENSGWMKPSLRPFQKLSSPNALELTLQLLSLPP